MIYPKIDRRVLVFFEDFYPFVGYWTGKEWCMELERLDCDTHTNVV